MPASGAKLLSRKTSMPLRTGPERILPDKGKIISRIVAAIRGIRTFSSVSLHYTTNVFLTMIDDGNKQGPDD
jgi:hypothetical protein